MREHGIRTCPDWCVQPSDEHLRQQHRGDWTEVLTRDGAYRIRARPLLSWWYHERTGRNHLEVEVIGPDGARAASIPVELLDHLRDLLSIGEMLIEGFDLVPGQSS